MSEEIINIIIEENKSTSKNPIRVAWGKSWLKY